MKFHEHDKKWITAAVWQFAVYAALVITCYFASTCFKSCSNDDCVDNTYRTEISGHYNILETGENISIERNGTWWIDESAVYPDDDIYGTYAVNESDRNVIYFSYYIESEDKDTIDTMTVVVHAGNSKHVVNAPTHRGETLTFEYTGEAAN